MEESNFDSWSNLKTFSGGIESLISDWVEKRCLEFQKIFEFFSIDFSTKLKRFQHHCYPLITFNTSYSIKKLMIGFVLGYILLIIIITINIDWLHSNTKICILKHITKAKNNTLLCIRILNNPSRYIFKKTTISAIIVCIEVWKQQISSSKFVSSIHSDHV